MRSAWCAYIVSYYFVSVRYPQAIEDREKREREEEEKKKRAEEEKKQEAEEAVFVEHQFVAREWKSHGSEVEVESMKVKDSRPKVRLVA